MARYDIKSDMRYLQLLSQSFPTIAEASKEIINLQSILCLPKERNISWQTSTGNMRRSNMS